MKVTTMCCSDCGQSTKSVNRCDNCFKTIDHVNEIFFDYLIIRRTDPEGENNWGFEFCSPKCMVEWMQKRILHEDNPSFTPYIWEDELRKRNKTIEVKESG